MGNATARAILLGLLIIPLNNYWLFNCEIVLLSGHPSTTSIFFNSIFILLVLVCANSGVRRFWPAKAFSQAELLTVYVMVNIATALGSHDMIQVLLPALVHPFKFATPENRWDAMFVPWLPEWLTVRDPVAVNAFFRGNASFYDPRILAAWLVPLAMWTVFIITLLFMMLCLTSILRKQWTEHEKLSYPLVQLPVEIAAEQTPLYRNSLLWLGIAFAVAIDMLEGLHVFYPTVPAPNIKNIDLASYLVTRPWSAVGYLPARFYPFGVGLAFLLPLDLSFSSWFFYIFWKAELVITAAAGLDNIPRFPYVTEQSFGAYMGIAAFALWISRRQLVGVLATALKGGSEDDDKAEALRHRTAVFGLLAGSVVMWVFLRGMGMSPWLIAPFFIVYFAMAIGITRMRAELGPPAHDLHHAGPDTMLPAILGPQTLGPGSLVAFSLLSWFNRAYRAHPMPFMLEGLKAAERSRGSYRRFAAAIVASTVVGTICTFWIQLHVYYKLGSASRVSWVPLVFGSEPYNRLDGWMRGASIGMENTVAAISVGLGFTILLNALRMRLPWFPFHPVGFAISSSWSMNHLWVCMFIAWLAKLLVLRYGGLRLYRRVLPLFLGAVIGECIMASVWSLIGMALNVTTYAVWP